jgi:hypothetical protein
MDSHSWMLPICSVLKDHLAGSVLPSCRMNLKVLAPRASSEP